MIEVSFPSLLSKIVDNRGRTAPTASTGTPLIATNCIKEDGLYPTFENVRYVDNETMKTWFRAHPEPGDILFVCKGSPGRVALVPSPVSFCIAQDMVSLRADPSKVYPRYLFAALRSSVVRRRIDSMHVGSLIPHFKKGDFNKLKIPLVGQADQQYIGDLYFNFCDKIESNRRLSNLLLAFIRTHVDLTLQHSRDSHPVSDLAQFLNGGAYTKGASGTGRMVLRIAELNSGPGPSTVYSDREVPENQTARAGDLLMSWSGSLDIYRWFRDEAIINQHIFKVVPKKYPSWLVFDRLAAIMPIFRGIAKDKATTMGHIQRGHLESTFVDLPSVANIEALDRTLGVVWERVLVAEAETAKLLETRDAFLAARLSDSVAARSTPTGATR